MLIIVRRLRLGRTYGKDPWASSLYQLAGMQSSMWYGPVRPNRNGQVHRDCFVLPSERADGLLDSPLRNE